MCVWTFSHLKNGRFLEAVMRCPMVTCATLERASLEQNRQRQANVFAVGENHIKSVAPVESHPGLHRRLPSERAR